MNKLEGLAKSLEQDRTRFDEPLAAHTTLGIGGPAQLFYETRNSGEFVKAVRLARNFGVPVTIIGGGSNVLVSDLGVKGLVIKNFSNSLEIGKEKARVVSSERNVVSRWEASTKGTQRYDFRDLDYDESANPRIIVTIDSGVSLQLAMMKLLERGITGLQWYSRIPGTVGGAIYNNIHGGSHMIQEVLERVVVITKEGDVRAISGKSLQMRYDHSIFHNTEDLIVKAELSLYLGDKNKAIQVADEWRKRKSVQPMNSAGCVFKNISSEDKDVLGYPTCATGYLIEHVLNMTGYSAGRAAISPNHHNFIVNMGGATAKDYLAVRDEVVRRAREAVGIELEDEIVKIGDFNY